MTNNEIKAAKVVAYGATLLGTVLFGPVYVFGWVWVGVLILVMGALTGVAGALFAAWIIVKNWLNAREE